MAAQPSNRKRKKDSWVSKVTREKGRLEKTTRRCSSPLVEGQSQRRSLRVKGKCRRGEMDRKSTKKPSTLPPKEHWEGKAIVERVSTAKTVVAQSQKNYRGEGNQQKHSSMLEALPPKQKSRERAGAEKKEWVTSGDGSRPWRQWWQQGAYKPTELLCHPNKGTRAKSRGRKACVSALNVKINGTPE